VQKSSTRYMLGGKSAHTFEHIAMMQLQKANELDRRLRRVIKRLSTSLLRLCMQIFRWNVNKISADGALYR